MKYHKWDDYESAAEHGPAPILWLAFFLILGVVVVIGSCSYIGGWFTETAQVVKEEFGARAMLEKYEWFKDAAAALDAKRASIAVYEQRFQQLRDTYGDTSRNQWARDDREQYNLWQSEVAGVTASYNALAADYNAQMAKFNWRFANAGTLPAGATVPLPREYRPYMTEGAK